jgi:hypothetical protein
MAARKAAAGKKAVTSTRQIPSSQKRKMRDAVDLEEARRRNYEPLSARSGSAKREKADDPSDQGEIQAKREKNAEKNREAVRRREQQVAESLAPGPHPNVLVVKRTEMAAKQEQERLDRQTIKGKGGKPPANPDEPGFVHEPHHPNPPNALGASPRHPDMPDGPQGEDVICRTPDVEEDGTPFTGQVPIKDYPEWDGENDRDYNEVAKRAGRVFQPRAYEWGDPAQWEGSEAELINTHSPEGAALDSIKYGGRPVRFVPTDAYLDPVAHKPGRDKQDD